MDPMEKRGSREELTEHLRESAEGWYHLAKDELSDASSAGADALEAGADEVQVGHTVYRVE